MVALLLVHFDWDSARPILARMDWALILAAAGVYMLIQVVRTVRFVVFVPSAPVPTLTAITVMHVFLLRILPVRAGELAYAVLMRRAGLAGLGQGVAHLILLRLVDAFCVTGFFCVALLADPEIYGGDVDEARIWAAVALGVGLAILWLLAEFLAAGVAVVRGFATLFGLTGRQIVQRGLAALDDIVAETRQLRRITILEASLATVVMWSLNFGVMWVLLRAFGFDLGVTEVVIGGSAAVVASFVPIGAVGTFGTLEAGWALGFALVGMSTGDAVATALGYSLFTLLFAGTAALPAWLVLRKRAGGRPAGPAGGAPDVDPPAATS